MKALTIYGIIFILLMIAIVYAHELSHVEIYKHHGIESKIQMYPTPKTIPISTNKIICDKFCKLGHDNADSFTYPFLMFSVLIGFIGFFIIGILEDIAENEK